MFSVCGLGWGMETRWSGICTYSQCWFSGQTCLFIMLWSSRSKDREQEERKMVGDLLLFLHLYFGIGQLLGNYVFFPIPFFLQEWSCAPLPFELIFLEKWLSSLNNLIQFHLIVSINFLWKIVNFMVFFVFGKLNLSVQRVNSQINRGRGGALID